MNKVAHEMKVYNSNYDSTSIYNGLIPSSYQWIGIDSVATYVNLSLNQYYSMASLLSYSEQNLMNSFVTNIIQADFSSLTRTQAFDSIATLVNALITQYNTIDWDTVSSIGGTLMIAKESGTYHKEKPTSPAFLIVWMDALGFVSQEAYEISTELAEFGHLDIKKSNGRVSRSIGRAVMGSTLGFFGRFIPK